MTRPVVSKVMQDAGWDRNEFDRRDTMIMSAAMEVFPTRNSWCSRSQDNEKSERLLVAMRPVAVRFSKLGSNQWYTHNSNQCKGRDYLEGLSHACAQWARGQMSYRRTHFQGWWDSNGSKIEEFPDPSLVLKFRLGPRRSDSMAVNASTRPTTSPDERDTTSPLSTPPASEAGASRSLQKDSPAPERGFAPIINVPQEAQQDLSQVPTLNNAENLEDRNRMNSASDQRRPAVVAPLPEQHTPNATTVAIDWAELSIDIDAANIGKDDLWILMQYLLPDGKPSPTWRDFEYQKFLHELVEVTDSHELEHGQHDLIYMDGTRRHPIKNKHDYAMMLKKFSKSYSAGEDTIKLKLEGDKNKGSRTVKLEPFVIDMNAFRPHISIGDDTNIRGERATSEARDQAISEDNIDDTEDLPTKVLAAVASPTLPVQSDVIENNLEEQEEERRLLGPMTNREGERSSRSTRKCTPSLKRREMDDARDAIDGEGSAGEQHSKRRAIKKQDSGHRMRANQALKSKFARISPTGSKQPVPDYNFVSL